MIGSPEEKAKRILAGFGFDVFESGQIVHSFKEHGVLSEVHDDNTVTKVYEALRDQGWSDTEVLDAVHSIQNAGILFRERS